MAYNQKVMTKNLEVIPLDAEERKGLLSNSDHDDVLPQYEDHDFSGSKQGSSRKKRIAIIAAGFITLLLGAAIVRPLSRTICIHSTTAVPHQLLSNGTHDFKKTVLIVSIDALRADYLDRGFTPHLLDISKEGLRAKYVKPIFPTLTFPNHWALMTGLYAESHGIVANNFWDPETGNEFHYNTREGCWNASWWSGEPMWESAGKAGMITANLMWPGPPATTSGAEPTYFVPWRDHVPLSEKLDQIMAWIDLPLAERPQFIAAYEPSLDQAGHAYGPYSKVVNETLVAVDVFARDLHTSLKARNLTDIVDIVFVSDHGMTDTSNLEYVYLDDFIGEEGVNAIEHEDGWPAMGLRFTPACNSTEYLHNLLDGAQKSSGKFDVYTHETMPERYHFSNNKRIAPIYVVPRPGYALTTKAQGKPVTSKGNHGYDNDEESMHAIFVAHGPFSSVVKATHHESLLPNKNKGWHSTSDDVYVMDGFQNVEVYNLVMKLLGVDRSFTANTNGTEGFWDKYF